LLDEKRGDNYDDSYHNRANRLILIHEFPLFGYFFPTSIFTCENLPVANPSA